MAWQYRACPRADWSGRRGLRENRLDRDVEWRAGRFPIREIDLGIRTNCSNRHGSARDMSAASLSQVLSIRCGQQCRPCLPFPDPTRPPRARECEAQRSEMKLCRTGQIRVPQLSASTHTARSPSPDATEETHREELARRTSRGKSFSTVHCGFIYMRLLRGIDHN